MDGKLLFGIIIIYLIYLVILLFIASIPIFSFIVFRKISKDMPSTNRSAFGLVLILINSAIIFGTYFFMVKPMLE